MMTAAAVLPWHEANQRYLSAALAVVRAALETGVGGPGTAGGEGAERRLHEAAQAMPAPSALDTLCAAFGLTRFERGILLLCAGVELDAELAAAVGAAQGDVRRIQPTFGLALAALPDAHWSALSPVAALRRWRLVDVGVGDTLAQSPLRIDERVLHYLTGIEHLDERLRGMVEVVNSIAPVPPSHRALADTIAGIWSRHDGPATAPIIALHGNDQDGLRAVALAACAALGIRLCTISVDEVPAAVDMRETWRASGSGRLS